MRISDWSSDVCSSDLNVGMDMNPIDQVMKTIAWFRHWLTQHAEEFALVGSLAEVKAAKAAGKLAVAFDLEGSTMLIRSAERRGGKECVSPCRSRWSPYH